jgi:hypothetical protein
MSLDFKQNLWSLDASANGEVLWEPTPRWDPSADTRMLHPAGYIWHTLAVLNRTESC